MIDHEVDVCNTESLSVAFEGGTLFTTGRQLYEMRVVPGRYTVGAQYVPKYPNKQIMSSHSCLAGGRAFCKWLL